jgi:hypothetical protein
VCCINEGSECTVIIQETLDIFEDLCVAMMSVLGDLDQLLTVFLIDHGGL